MPRARVSIVARWKSVTGEAAIGEHGKQRPEDTMRTGVRRSVAAGIRGSANPGTTRSDEELPFLLDVVGKVRN